jgi:hypothetical protein
MQKSVPRDARDTFLRNFSRVRYDWNRATELHKKAIGALADG